MTYSIYLNEGLLEARGPRGGRLLHVASGAALDESIEVAAVGLEADGVPLGLGMGDFKKLGAYVLDYIQYIHIKYIYR